jgi:hypothetical protein
MQETDYLAKGYTIAYNWTMRLVKDVPAEDWHQTVEPLNTTLNWQVGHLVITLYYQALVCSGADRGSIKEQIPIKEYIAWYSIGSKPSANDRPTKNQLLQALEVVYNQVMKVLPTVSDDNLNEPVASAHPVAKTKGEALLWCSHHQSWHNGQIALTKRALFGKSF